MRPPRVSIGLPVSNGERYLPRALDSLLQQDFEDFELIISDNASTDGSKDICQAYASRDSRIRYFRADTNHGAAWNFRQVFERAQGGYFKWAAYDDECYPSMLRRCVETLDSSAGSLVLVYPRAEIIDESGRVSGEAPDHVNSSEPSPHRRLARVLRRVALGHAIYGLVKSHVLRATRGCVHSASDHLLLGELAMHGEIYEIPEVLFRLRLHPANAMRVNRTSREMHLWSDPSDGRRPLLPYKVEIALEHLKSVRHVPLTPAERLMCLTMVFLVPSWRELLRVTGRPRKWAKRVVHLPHGGF